MATTIGTINTDGLEDALRQLPGKIETDRVAEKALKAGARVVGDQVVANLKSHGSEDSGLLAKSLRIRRRTDTIGGLIEVALNFSNKLSMVVRPSRWSKKPVRARPAKYAHFPEFGTEHAPAKPFFRPAVEAKREEAEQVIAKTAEAGVVKAAQQLGMSVK